MLNKIKWYYKLKLGQKILICMLITVVFTAASAALAVLTLLNVSGGVPTASL
ncbi:MAG: hypothetical protein GX936_07590, partial [Clostridiales bacterium]|nr:hypothetical protein [Clostridiales bacterium]